MHCLNDLLRKISFLLIDLGHEIPENFENSDFANRLMIEVT